MITMLLLLVIYIAFIGMGLPSPLFGAALTTISTDFAISEATASYVTVILTGFTVVSAMFGSRFVNKFGTHTVVTVCTILATLSFLGFSHSPTLWVMCLFAIPLGLSAGATDAALNNYISLHYKAIHMNFMHCFFGIGTILSPSIMSVNLANNDWRGGYRMVFIIQAVIALIVILSFPLWKKVKHEEQTEDEDSLKPENLSYISMAKNSAIRLIWLLCLLANIAEGVVSIWGSSFLIDAHRLSEASAAGLITMFFGGIALGRFLSGLLSTKLSAWSVIKFSTIIMFIGTGLMFVPHSTVAVVGLLLVGLGVGPIYPNLMYLTPKHFGQKHSASILGSQMAAAYSGFLIGPPMFGWFANAMGSSVLPAYILASNVIFVAAAYFFLRKVKQH